MATRGIPEVTRTSVGSGTGRASRTSRSVVLARITAGLLALTVGVDALYLLGLLSPGGAQDPVVNVGLSLATQWVPVSVFWLVAARSGFSRWAVLLAAAGVTSSALGDTYWAVAMDADGSLPFPSPADPAYLLFYPFMIAALTAFAHDRLRGIRGLVLLETIVATLGASALLALALDPVLGDALAGDATVGTLVAVAYPLFDLVLLAVLAGFASVPGVRVGRRAWALVAGLAVFTVADVVYALLQRDGAYAAGTPLDAAWAVGLAFITWWGAGMAQRPSADVPAARAAGSLPLPTIAVLAGLAVLVVATQTPLSPLVVVLAALTVGFAAAPIAFRQAVLGRMVAAQEEAVRRLTELDRAKTDIMVTMNHEFRTPLTSLNGHVELLLDGGAGELPRPAVGMLETIERNGARLRTLLDETLTASRLEEGLARIERSPVELDAIVADAVDWLVPLAAQRGVEVEVRAAGDDVVVEADAVHLGRAFVDLIDNAIKFSPEGGRVSVTVSAEHGARRAVVRIADDGLGIPDGELESVFDRYARGSNVQNAAIPGVGLGLTIARHVVRAHGGTIDLASRLGAGTTATVALPLPKRPGRRPRQSSNSSPST